MPAPHHLLPILTVLGDGGSTEVAEAVAARAGGLPGQVPAPTVDAVMGALGDRATVDVAEALVDLYTPVAEFPPAEAPVSAPETPQAPAGDVNGGETPEDEGGTVADDSDPQDDDGIDWDDAPTDTEAAPDATAPETDAAPPVPAPSAAVIRAWAKTQGIKVPARGAIPADVRDAYTPETP